MTSLQQIVSIYNILQGSALPCSQSSLPTLFLGIITCEKKLGVETGNEANIPGCSSYSQIFLVNVAMCQSIGTLTTFATIAKPVLVE